MSIANEDYSSLAGIDWGSIGSGFTNGQLNITGPDVIYGTGQQGGGGPSQAELDAANNAAAMDRQKQQQEYETAVRQRAAIDAVQAAFSQYGLQSLFGKVEEYARAGYNADAIALMLRSTPEYKARFPAMQSLMDKGRAISEAQYIDYERNTASIEQRYGLPSGMLMGHVTDLLTNEVSLSELNDRVTLASADSLMAPQDLRDTLRDYYGLDPDTALAAYYLDPDIAMPLLEKQSASARIGVWASRNGLSGVGASTAEGLQGLGVSEDQAKQGFGTVAATREFGAGRGDVASQDTRIQGVLGGNAESAAAMERAGRARTGRFAGGGQFAAGKSGVSGIGSSSS
jgi:hypothetical protein